jgi:hypothetical protein
VTDKPILQPFEASVTISRAELEAASPMPDLAEQRYRELMDAATREMQPEAWLNRSPLREAGFADPRDSVAADFEQLAAEHKALKDFEAGKPLKLADGRTLIRAPDDPDKAYVLPKPPSLAEIMRDAFKPGWSGRGRPAP